MSFSDELARSLQLNRITRRQALWLLGAGTLGAAGVSLQGCATSPVTGKSILVGMSEAQERAVDAQVSPHQFSADMGAIQDGAVNDYVSGVGRSLAQRSHRPQMPYSYRVLNANYINAYTFPGGAMGVTRGILTELDDEAELAALLGHEIGHVNARHAAQRQGKALLAQVAIASVAVATSDSEWGTVAGLGSTIGASALLASYSRDNEREADALGQEYMARGGYPATGMVRLHQLLVDQEKHEPSLLETMFSSHPMSTERRNTARELANTRYAASKKADPQRERFMDSTASLRKLKSTIDECKRGETALAAKEYKKAEEHFQAALKLTPDDYAANLRMAQCLQAQKKNKEAREYASKAKEVYPQEAQAHKLLGVLSLGMRQPDAAYESLHRFDQLLPGDPGVTFLMGVALEGSGDKKGAAQQYRAYLGITQQGDAAKYSAQRLKSWGYLR
ncbi:MAG: M48 family metalloprotease [Pseudomonadota bacterium]